MTCDFVVLGLPRSGTTWVANWLTTDRSLCLHDPFAAGTPEHWPRDERRFGISCTGAYLFPRWLSRQRCPVVAIERPVAECNASVERLGFGSIRGLSEALKRVDAPRWRFADLWDEARAKALWEYLLPGLAFDALRYRMLREMQVQPYMPAWHHEPAVFHEMMRREAGG